MAQDFAEGTRVLNQMFPATKTDKKFKVTSRDDENFNCIAWAMRFSDRWVDPVKTAGHWWPVDYSQRGNEGTPDALKHAFELMKFEECKSPDIEAHYDKVALYFNPLTMGWSHACRIIADGECHSKLGEGWDFHHGLGNILNNPSLGQYNYGKIFCYMKRHKIYRFYSFYLSLKLLGDKLRNEIKCIM